MWFLRKIAFTAGILLLLTGVVFTLVTISYFYLPSYLEREIIPKITKDIGITEYAIDIRDVGFFGADLGALRIGPADNPALVIQSVQIDYSPTVC